MTEPMRRVALLVRHDAAGDRLRSMLAEAGIESVLQGDPTELAVESLAQASPHVVLVALDPDIEDALERFESVLGNPDIDVIYEEAELAAAREGWEAARWKRHLLAKLQGHDRVLPPRPDGTVDEPRLRLQTVGEVSDEDYAAFDPGALHDGQAMDVDAGTAGQARTDRPPFAASEDVEMRLDGAGDETLSYDGLTFDSSSTPSARGQEINHAFDPVNAEQAGDDADGQGGFEISFEPASIEADADAGLELELDDDDGIEIVFDEGAEAVSASPRAGGESPLGLDEHLRSFSIGSPASGAASPELPGDDTSAVDEVPASSARASTSFGELSLDDGSGHYAAADTAGVDARFGRDLADLDERIAALELVEDRLPQSSIPGAVLVLAGIGGPDAVRQFLGALPVDFPRPVLVQQRLDGGRYDRLVAQMQRATTLPVQLAEPGRLAMAGFIYVLPAGLGIVAAAEGMRFVADGEVLSTLPSADSAILMLSGSEPADVDAALKHRAGGAFVAGQAPEGCYDPAAPDQLAVRGGELAPPVELAQRLAARWPA